MKSDHGNNLDMPSLRKVSFGRCSFFNVQLAQFESMSW